MSMDEQQRQALERDIRSRVAAGDCDGATTAALSGYGPEILRFLVAMHGNEAAASDAFSLFAEGVWRGIARFAWECSFRTWAYAVARRVSLRQRRDEGRHAAHRAPLGEDSVVLRIAADVRTRTLSFLRTERRDRFAELRDALPPEDRELLILRVDRQLAWNELVHALQGDDAEPLTDERIKREAARLRKRFQLIKERLLAAGRRDGLLGSDDGEH
jgi:RNA polymerase sigma-70 factor (ECF subfamily)